MGGGDLARRKKIGKWCLPAPWTVSSLKKWVVEGFPTEQSADGGCEGGEGDGGGA